MKNRAAVHLGKKSAEKRRKLLGEKGFAEKMKEIRRFGKQKPLSPGDATNA